MVLFVFIIFYCLAFGYIGSSYKVQNSILISALFAISVMIGLRTGWPDMGAYQRAFNAAPFLSEWNLGIRPVSYSEKGYFLLCSLIKTVYNNVTFYFFVMGLVSMFFLYKNLKIFCLFPLIGLCDYIGRFLLNRDFTQMRSSLMILIVVLGLKYLLEKKAWKYFLVILIAYQIHHAALIAAPFYFFNLVEYKKWHLWIGIILAIVLSFQVSDTISGFVDYYSEDLHYDVYTEGGYVERALGLRNPMIYFQIVLLMFFAYSEKWLKPYSKYYYIYRNAYFYSTLILILFCNYTALSGRTSTIFATVEMFMLPMIGKSLSDRKVLMFVFYISIGAILSFFFYQKYYTMHVSV